MARPFPMMAAAAMLALVFSVPVAAGDSFRLKNGRLLSVGMSRVELLSEAGQPLSRDRESTGIDTGRSRGRTAETWSYVLEGDIGGRYYVSITLVDGQVTGIHSRQRDRD